MVSGLEKGISRIDPGNKNARTEIPKVAMGGVSKEKRSMKAYHDIQDLRFSGEHMILTIDGEEKKFRIKEISSSLEAASQNERNAYEISPSGYGIHWPLIDEDISIDALLGIVHTREPRRKTT